MPSIFRTNAPARGFTDSYRTVFDVPPFRGPEPADTPHPHQSRSSQPGPEPAAHAPAVPKVRAPRQPGHTVNSKVRRVLLEHGFTRTAVDTGWTTFTGPAGPVRAGAEARWELGSTTGKGWKELERAIERRRV